MKRIFFIFLSLLFVAAYPVRAQIFLEVGGGYLTSFDNFNAFKHTNNGWQLCGTVFYKISEIVEAKTSFIYQSRIFAPKSFSFIVPAVAGITVPIVSDGDNLKSFLIKVGGRLKPKSDKIVRTILDADVGINFFQSGYYYLEGLNEGTRPSLPGIKYADSKALFETSVGLGVEIKPMTNFSFIIEAKINYIPSTPNFYFPIISNIRVGI
ncbi:MAG TPA: hypothetical protein PK073_02805 [Ignavibacteriaceae bacterium]|jgi:hypothetical protein|nr:MAG: hypothetical protein BWY38_01929 [Ignavibacteria bacterium ADurb.Bin266]OQY74178.1 MAG: hypothetical protein B6D44_05045 [Ignavibacteriales bacterium UTCHB2]HQF41816.1 hypothetical protein [Ignavibacteriaceae bacterium]HQI39856.1 hypothetical protein [Ignavibacteriaceae bacterium]